MTQKVDLFYELLDQAIMIYYDNLNIDYLNCFLKVAKGIINDEIDSKLPDEVVKQLEEIYRVINNENFYNEEIRLALELIIIKAFKHIQYRLPLMTPDTVNYLMANLISKKFNNLEITIMDTLLGSANMLMAIANHYDGKLNLIGIEDDLRLVELSKAVSELQNNEITIYFQDALASVMDLADVVVGDFDSYEITDGSGPLYEDGVRYFPYLLFSKRLENIKENGYFIYLIDNDFFNQEKNHIFQNYLKDKATLQALIVLPNSMFKDNHVGKSILIGKKCVSLSYQMTIIEIPSFEEESLKKSIKLINEMIEQI